MRDINETAVRWAAVKETGDPRAKLVLLVVASAVDQHGRCRIFLGRLADRCEMSPRIVLKKLHRLEETGLLEKRPARGEAGKQGLYDFRLRGDLR